MAARRRPIGDLDGDGEVNFVEAGNGTFTTDACSTSNASLHTAGVTSATNGGTASWEVRVGPGSVGFVA